MSESLKRPTPLAELRATLVEASNTRDTDYCPTCEQE